MVMTSEAYKSEMYDQLLPIYGSKESKNIVSYYFDAMYDINDQIFEEHLTQLKKGVPVQYVTNTSFFYGYQFYVDNRVLIPRAETEELVYWIEQDVKGKTKTILDIGTGSGCILLSLLKKNQSCQGTGLDVSAKAIEVFKINQEKLDLKVSTIVGNVLTAECTDYIGKYDVIVSNPPYILTSEKERMGTSVIAEEPHLALFVEADDPLVFYKCIIELAETHLNINGSMYFETSDLYHEELKTYLESSPYKYEFRKDMQDNWRMLKVTKN